MHSVQYKDENGNIMDISVVGDFFVPPLEKEFIMYSFMDKNVDNHDGYILLGEVVKDGNNIQVLGIEEDEKNIVLEYYKEISNQLGDDDNE